MKKNHRFRVKEKSAFTLLFCAFLLTACGGDPDAMPVAFDTLRCNKPGLCLYATGKKSLQGGYREGSEEVKFDVIYRPFHGFSVGGVVPWCIRLVDQKNQEFSTHNNEHCPNSWYTGDGVQRITGDPSWMETLDKRDQLTKQLQQALLRADVPDDRTTALYLLQDMVDTHVIAIDDPEHMHIPVRRNKAGIVEPLMLRVVSAQEREAITQQAEAEDRILEESLKSSLQDEEKVTPMPSSPNESMRGEDFGDEDEWPIVGSSSISNSSTVGVEGEIPEPPAPATISALAFSKGSNDGVPKKSPEEVIRDPSMEYKQRIALYSKKVKDRLVWGNDTKKHHTASFIEVFHRPLGSDGSWKRIAADYTANHGSSPISSEMEFYALCEDTPVTYGRTVWKGECHGKWGLGDRNHLCNDDTRLQIRNAYNIASNKKCEKLDHYHRPWCHKR